MVIPVYRVWRETRRILSLHEVVWFVVCREPFMLYQIREQGFMQTGLVEGSTEAMTYSVARGVR